MARRGDGPLPSTMGDCEALAFESPEDAPAEGSEEPAEDVPPAHPARSREDTRPSELSDIMIFVCWTYTETITHENH